MGLLDFLQQKADHPSNHGFNSPLLAQHQRRSAELGKKTRSENQLAEILRPLYHQALKENPNADKIKLATDLVRAYNDNIESNFTQTQQQAFHKYRQNHSISPYRFSVLYKNASQDFKGSRLAESGNYNMHKWANLLGADNEQELQQIELNRLKQNRGQNFFSLETLTDMVADPANLIGGGMVAKGIGKGLSVAKSALASSGIGALYGANELNRDDISLKDNAKQIALSGAFGGLLGAGGASLYNKLSTGKWLGTPQEIQPPNLQAQTPQQATQGVEISEISANNLNRQAQPQMQPKVEEGLQAQTSSQTQEFPKSTLAVQQIKSFLDERLYPANKGVEISEASVPLQGKGIKKDDGEVVHLTRRDVRPKDFAVKYPLVVEPPTHYHTSTKMEQGAGVKTHSLKDNGILPQTPQQIKQFRSDLESIAKEYPQVFKTYEKELRQTINANPKVFFEKGALNKAHFRAMLEHIQAQTKQGQGNRVSLKKEKDAENTFSQKLQLDLKGAKDDYELALEGLVKAPTKPVHSQAIGEQFSKSRKLEPMHPNTPLENPNNIIPIKKQEKDKNRIYSLELEGLESKLSTKIHEKQKQSTLDSSSKDFDTSVDSNMSLAASNQIIPKESELLQRLERVSPSLADQTRLNALNKDLKEAKERFNLKNKDKENAKLFNKVIVVAQQLGVKFDTKGKSLLGELGHYNPNTNTAKVFTKGEKEAETILHELIHSVSTRALHAQSQSLTPLQREAVKEIKTIYETLSKDKEFKDTYALSSVDEMLAELSNKAFRTMLKGKNLLQRIYNAIAKIIFKRASNYERLENALYKLMDNYAVEPERKGADILKSVSLEKDFLNNDKVDLDALKKRAQPLQKHLMKQNLRHNLKNLKTQKLV